MKIKRDGIEIELTPEEIFEAYMEKEKDYILEDIENTAEELGFTGFLKEYDYIAMADIFFHKQDCNIAENEQKECIVRDYVKLHYSKEFSIGESIEKINGNNEWELLGFVISECTNDSENHYDEIGNAVGSLFEKYPENATLLDDMLVAICGYSLSSLAEKMEERRDYYNSL